MPAKLLSMPLFMQKAIVILVLLSSFAACTPQEKATAFLSNSRAIPERLQEVYQISKQTSYSLFDCDTTISEIRIWESPSRLTNTNALFLTNNSVSSTVFYLLNKNSSQTKKVTAVNSCQEQIVNAITGEEIPFSNATSGGPYLTWQKDAEATIDSLFKMGFAEMQSQPEVETQRVGDGISYVIEVRRGRFYKYVYYASPELFQNELARKFVKTCQFLTRGKWHFPKYQLASKK
ncbi:hypothetical protein MON38_18215 [Hymenobacter sp. DH14]|uniref:Lipoprotein n=1 Tax=Hymenobacter cyanobacteriorum TaxID=2926463 RepID=A0A9X1VJJ7_9BACT|nr:hypothetical protein [Hymenobacter cyanobacteriorum]MCI1189363.1 hypothetical protein [Hymenobacter cyanobacteriorum]